MLRLPKHPQLSYLGPVSPEEKQALLAGALALVNPSPYESLSLVVLEAIMASKPVIVNGNCPALRWYAQQLPSVFAYTQSAEFADCVAMLGSPKWQAASAAHLATAKRWVATFYSWPRIEAAYLGPLPKA